MRIVDLEQASHASSSILRAWTVWCRVHGPRCARRTRAEYASSIKRAIAWLPDRPTAAEVAEWHRETLTGLYSPRYANCCLHVLAAVVRAVTDVTGDRALLAAVASVRPYRREVLAPRCPPRDLLDRALPVARNDAERAFLYLASLGGLRRGELLGLRAEDWEPATCTMRVVRQRLEPRRKNNRPHSVCLASSPDACAAISAVVASPVRYRSRMGFFRGRSRGFLFEWSTTYLAHFLGRLRKALPGYFPSGAGWHLFRHWGASELGRRGASTVEIQAWLGDASPDIACAYVAQLRGATVGVVDRLVGPAPVGPKRVELSGSRATATVAGVDFVYEVGRK